MPQLNKIFFAHPGVFAYADHQFDISWNRHPFRDISSLPIILSLKSIFNCLAPTVTLLTFVSRKWLPDSCITLLMRNNFLLTIFVKYHTINSPKFFRGSFRPFWLQIWTWFSIFSNLPDPVMCLKSF